MSNIIHMDFKNKKEIVSHDLQLKNQGIDPSLYAELILEPELAELYENETYIQPPWEIGG